MLAMRKMRAAIVVVWLIGSPVIPLADESILRHVETVLDLVAQMSAACAQHYPDQLSAKARAALNFSEAEIVAYCACSTKLVVQQMEEADFLAIERTGVPLPPKFIEPLKQAHFRCAKKLWDVKQKR